MKEKLNANINLALLILGVFCQIEMLLRTLRCPVDSIFYLWLSLICAGLWYTAHGRKYNWAGIVLSLLLLAFLWYTEKPDVSAQLNDFFDRIAGLISERYLRPNESYSYRNTASGFGFLFLVFGFLECAYLTIALSSKGARTDLALLGTLPFCVFCVAVSNYPPLLPLLGMLLFWFLTAVGGSFYRKESGSGIGVLLSLLPLIALLAALLLVINPDTYEYQAPQLHFTEQLSVIRKSVQKLAQKLPHEEIQIPSSAQFPPSEYRQSTPSPSSQEEEMREALTDEQPVDIMWQDAEGKMDLTQEADVSALDTAFLELRTSEDTLLYLRAVSFGDYTGTGWLSAEETAPFSSLSLTAQALDAAGVSEKRLTVQPLKAAPFRFLPYFSEDQADSDSFVPAQSASRYVTSYYSGTFTSGFPVLPAEFAEEELSYRQYAHNVYTRLPDATRSALLSILDENGLTSAADPVSSIAAYVQHTGEYDISAGSYPTSDYALYFLTEARRGYCIHFATAAAVLYRAAGIPARVTEGFLVRSEAGKNVEVTGADAHAWVEIYQDGLGWLPVEVTGQSGLRNDEEGDPYPVASPEPGPEETLAPESAAEPDITEASPSSPTVEPAENAVPNPEIDSSDQKQPADGVVEPSATPMPSAPTPTPRLPVGIVSDQPSSEKAAFKPLWLLVVPSSLIVLSPFIRFALRRRKQPDTHSIVIAVYRIASRLVPLGASVSPQIRSCAEKAAFSHHEITNEEASACKTLLTSTVSELETKLKPFSRLKLKVILLQARWRYPWLGI